MCTLCTLFYFGRHMKIVVAISRGLMCCLFFFMFSSEIEIGRSVIHE